MGTHDGLSDERVVIYFFLSLLAWNGCWSGAPIGFALRVGRCVSTVRLRLETRLLLVERDFDDSAFFASMFVVRFTFRWCMSEYSCFCHKIRPV